MTSQKERGDGFVTTLNDRRSKHCVTSLNGRPKRLMNRGQKGRFKTSWKVIKILSIPGFEKPSKEKYRKITIIVWKLIFVFINFETIRPRKPSDSTKRLLILQAFIDLLFLHPIQNLSIFQSNYSFNTFLSTFFLALPRFLTMGWSINDVTVFKEVWVQIFCDESIIKSMTIELGGLKLSKIAWCHVSGQLRSFLLYF